MVSHPSGTLLESLPTHGCCGGVVIVLWEGGVVVVLAGSGTI